MNKKKVKGRTVKKIVNMILFPLEIVGIFAVSINRISKLHMGI